MAAGDGKERAASVASGEGTELARSDATLVGDATVEDWFYDRYQSARINGNRWFVVAILFGVLACLAVGAVIVLTPLKTVQPFVVEVNNASGEVRTLKALDADELTPSDAVIKSFLARYVIARETYDPQDLKENYTERLK